MNVLSRDEHFPREALSRLRTLGPDERIPITKANALLESAVKLTGNPDLGLEAARSMSLGDGAVLDYAMSTAGSVGEAIAIAARYMRLVNDDSAIKLEVEGPRAVLVFAGEPSKVRAAVDFKMGAFYRIHVTQWVPPDAERQCWFAHGEPADLGAYRMTFGPTAVLRFTAPHYGFVFDKALLSAPLKSADHKLHEVLHQYMKLMCEALPSTQSFTEQVRVLLLRELLRGRPDAPHVAARLRMSVRTLSRKLEAERTNFKEVLESLRRQLALHHLARSDLSISEIAYVLGYSQVATFHRAFRRWTNQSPREYRLAVRAYRQPIPAEAQGLSFDEALLFPKSMLERTGS